MSGTRFTLYLSEAEQAELERVAEEYGTSRNYVARAAVRSLLGFTVPSWVTRLRTELTLKRREQRASS